MQNVTIEIEGMTCDNCSRHVRDALLAVEGVAAAEVSLRDGSARVTTQDTPAELSSLGTL